MMQYIRLAKYYVNALINLFRLFFVFSYIKSTVSQKCKTNRILFKTQINYLSCCEAEVWEREGVGEKEGGELHVIRCLHIFLVRPC